MTVAALIGVTDKALSLLMFFDFFRSTAFLGHVLLHFRGD
jgi:hypothetical protein